MQDWPIEVADGARLDEFVALLKAHASDWELTYWFLDLVLESAGDRDDSDASATRLVDTLVYACTATDAPPLIRRLAYWACEGDALEDAFAIAPVARHALAELTSRRAPPPAR